MHQLHQSCAAALEQVYILYLLELRDAYMSEAPEQQNAAATPANDDSREFLKTEYTNIASAHFAAGTTITNSFQFYLLTIGLPITVAGVVQKLGGGAVTSSAGIVQLLADPLVPISRSP